MKLSVIIPSYERSALLRRAIDSVLSQTQQPTEIIVVDDGSRDGTSSMVRESYPDLRLITLPENLGVSAARNAGIEAAENEWIAFLDSDDLWLPDKLAKQDQALEISGLPICHTDEIWVKGDRRTAPAKRYAKSGGWIFQKCLPVCAIGPSTVVIHRSIFDDVGLFDEGMIVCEDYDLWLRTTYKYEVCYVDEPLVEKHGGHEDQLSNQSGLDRYRILALEHIIAAEVLEPTDRQAAIDELLAKILIYAGGAEKHGNPEEAELFRAKHERWTNSSEDGG